MNWYNERCLENQHLFQEFLNRDTNSSTSQSVASRQYSKCVRKSTEQLIDKQLNNSNSRAIVRPSITSVIYTNNSSVNVMTINPNPNQSNISYSSK